MNHLDILKADTWTIYCWKIIVENRQSRKIGHKATTVLQMNEKFVLREFS